MRDPSVGVLAGREAVQADAAAEVRPEPGAKPTLVPRHVPPERRPPEGEERKATAMMEAVPVAGASTAQAVALRAATHIATAKLRQERLQAPVAVTGAVALLVHSFLLLLMMLFIVRTEATTPLEGPLEAKGVPPVIITVAPTYPAIPEPLPGKLDPGDPRLERAIAALKEATDHLRQGRAALLIAASAATAGAVAAMETGLAGS